MCVCACVCVHVHIPGHVFITDYRLGANCDEKWKVFEFSHIRSTNIHVKMQKEKKVLLLVIYLNSTYILTPQHAEVCM